MTAAEALAQLAEMIASRRDAWREALIQDRAAYPDEARWKIGALNDTLRDLETVRIRVAATADQT